jgi:hypothetical protein
MFGRELITEVRTGEDELASINNHIPDSYKGAKQQTVRHRGKLLKPYSASDGHYTTP